MRCLIFYYRNSDVEILKNHYIFYHQINKNNNFFKELFLPDNENIHLKRYEYWMQFKNFRQKKNHSFLVHREQQVGGSTNQQLPLNILREVR